MNQLTLPAQARRSDEDVVEALLCAVRAARWPDRSLLVDLDDIVAKLGRILAGVFCSGDRCMSAVIGC